MKIEKEEKNESGKQSEKEKEEIPISVASPSVSDFNSDHLKYENMKLGSPHLTPRELLDWLESP